MVKAHAYAVSPTDDSPRAASEQIMWQDRGTLTKAIIGNQISHELGFLDDKRYMLYQAQATLGNKFMATEQPECFDSFI